MKNALLSFYGTDPIVAVLLTIAALFLLAGLVARGLSACRDWWVDREQDRLDRQRRRLHSAMTVTEPRPWSAPAAKGFDRQRKVS